MLTALLAARRLAAPTALRALCVLALALLVGCREEEPAAPTLADTLARERAAAHFAGERWPEARATLRPLVAGEDAAVEDLVRAASVELADGDAEAAEGFLARAAKRAPEDAAVNFLRGQLRFERGDFEEARGFLETAHRTAPADLPTRILLAQLLEDLGAEERAEELYQSIVEIGIENGGSWYVSAVYRLGQMLLGQGREAEAARYLEESRRLSAAGIQAPSSITVARGSFGAVQPPEPRGTVVARPGALPAFEAEPPVLPELAGARVLLASALDDDRRVDLVAVSDDGVRVALQTAEGGWRVVHVYEGKADHVRLADLGGDDDVDILVVAGARATLLEAAPGPDGLVWSPSAVTLPELPGPPAGLVFVDFDHEGDMDLVFVGPFGARLWRNDGAGVVVEGGAPGAFVDVTAESGLPTDGPLDWCVTEDFDNDNDVDFLLGGSGRLVLADSLRGGRFADRTDRFPPGTILEKHPVVADLDGDARADVLVPGEPVKLWRQDARGTFHRESHGVAVPLAGDRLVATDLDLDGALDLLWPTQEGLAAAWLAVGLPVAKELAVAPKAPAAPTAPLVATDLDGDLDNDLVRATERGIEVFRASGAPGRGARLRPLGVRDNRRAVGARVELRAGSIYRRIYWRGEPEVVGIGEHERLDVLRIIYPNGTVQALLDVEPAEGTVIDDPEAAFGDYLQPAGQDASCPFLYTWNGETFEFVTDVLGITPLGLPMAPGVLVPPDHDEYVLIRGDQLVPKDGRLTLQFTEELHEVTYLDRVRLDVVDHPAGTRIEPNERFCFPPFPEPHTHVMRDPIAPLSAKGSDGRDWTAEVTTADLVHAVPFRRHPPQFAGLCEPWYLELAFDRERVAAAPKLRLALHGWFFWSNASVNMAAARTSGVDFVPPILQVPDGTGGWRAAGPPIGFPAGKTKTMVIDVTDVLVREDPRIRVFTTLELYWDEVRLAVCGDDEERLVTPLEPARAELWRRGFSEPIETGREDHPETFDWDRLAAQPRWDQHPGRYTRYGDVLPLLGAIDDRFVILGTGDALTIDFDARALPPVPEGFVRDYLLFLDGWAKDRNPNTVQALEVEPLPFHGMSGYPYGADERFPDTEEHRRWRAEWNTREAFPWIAPLAPGPKLEWLRGGAASE